MKAKQAGILILTLVVAGIIIITYSNNQGHDYINIKNGEGFILDGNVEVFKSSVISLRVQDWKYGGSTVTTVSWSYSVQVTVVNIQQYNITIHFGYKLSTASTITELDSKTLTGQTVNQTISDTGSEDLDTHTGRYVSSPQSGSTYTFYYYIKVEIYGIGALSGELRSDILDWTYKASATLEYSSIPVISQVIWYDATNLDVYPDLGTDVTEGLTDGKKENLEDGICGGAPLDDYLLVFVFKIVFSGSGTEKIRIYFGTDAYKETGFEEGTGVYISSDGSSYSYSTTEVYWESEFYNIIMTSDMIDISGTLYVKCEIHSADKITDVYREIYAMEIELVQPTSSWVPSIAGFLIGFFVAIGLVFAIKLKKEGYF